ncbi:nudix (nucleoside diphosphate linked moiety X)-type motif 8 [Linnemannia exigua]|uniref:Nudix (Nucleoside diphosphate linked moiety X)-type motif 8 n=1 Tax=Linnemannia exigua TaxID=604196 RepID=A0AAD4D9W2_9FUNG|nr:nudix (nucleoside diphosphate linked moiety X)-type motif 8 [Linnemannia exigua]
MTSPSLTLTSSGSRTRTRVTTTITATRTRSSLVAPNTFKQQQQRQQQHHAPSSKISAAATAAADFASQPFLLSGSSQSKIFAPQYQTHTPLPLYYQSQLPYQVPPVPKAMPFYKYPSTPSTSQTMDTSPAHHQVVYPSHQQRVKRQPSLKHASYASRTIPHMMSAPVCEQRPIQFDRAFLDLARKRLEEGKDRASHHFDYCKDKPLREAAVLMPFCVVKGVPSVLFTLRSTKMRNHRGECSFPGGKRDPADKSCLETALREMEEEVFISRDQVEILGDFTPMPNKDCTMRVQPYIGLIRQPINDISEIKFNPDEVSKVFTIPVDDLLDPVKRKNLVRFRDSKYMYPIYHVEEEDCTVWGLTAFIMDGVLRRILRQGPEGAMICPENGTIQRYKPAPIPVA